ncbi:Ig-like domain-containing protein [Paenibacillaceae bacterium WGS1546]|uniref:Ig-like domain-containing protein n=1 Tax=Cohnella sp. WGS1546 TaxID=3366810 RepID=UPI00372D82EA
MRKFISGVLALLMLLSVPYTAWGASNLTTEQKFEVLKQNQIFTGFSDGSSRLYDPMSREQLAAVLYRLLGLTAASTAPSYDDVPRTRWSFQEIEAVKRAGLMNGTKARTFSPLDNVTVEQLAAILTRSYGLSGYGSVQVNGRVSNWARGAVSLALDRKLIPQLNDYTVDATRGLLVEAAYAIYEDMNVEPLKVRSVEQLTNQSVRINLYQWTDPWQTNVGVDRFALKDVYGNIRNIHQATIGQDGLSVVLWTDRQIGGILHLLTVDGNVWSYTSAQEDTTKPQIVSQPVRLSNGSYELTFSEPLDQASATNASNYQFSGGLRMKTLQLSADQRKVIFTTTGQTDGRNYQLTVRNVKDLAGNVMDTRSDLYLIGNNDNTKPKVSEVKIDVVTALVSVKFSEKIDPHHAAMTYHYTIDKGLSVLQATLQEDGRTVILRTSPQRDGQFYTLTVSGIPDLAGNVMDTSTNWRFGAVPNPVAQARLQSIVAINKNTLEVSFNRSLSDADVRNLKLSDFKANGADYSTSGWSAYVARKPGTDKAATIQYRNKASGNPDLFVSGSYYTARVSGVAGLDASGGADTQHFGGTFVDNAIPYATQATALDRRSVKVQFSEPVKNVKASAFAVWRDDRKISVDSVDAKDAGTIVTEVVLRFDDELRGNRRYAITFERNGITDAAGWNGIKTSEGNRPYAIEFNL